MTTEIAILNKSAVALASDSAVTITHGAPDELNYKIYADANKLFELIKGTPVGIMIFNSAEIAGVPWETLIKLYRSRNRLRQFDTLSEYVNDFLASVELILGSQLESDEQDAMRHQLFGGIFAQLNDEISELIAGESNKLTRRKLYSDALDQVLAQVGSREIQEWAAGLTDDSVLRRFGQEVTDAIPVDLDDVRLSYALRKKFARVIVCVALRHNHQHGPWSGIVISGFGENEMFPSLYDCRIAGFFDGRLVRVAVSSHGISSTNPSIIQTYAQTGEAIMFLQGIDPGVSNAVSSFWKTWSDGLHEAVSEIVKNEVSGALESEMTEVRNLVKAYMTKSWDGFAEYMNTEFHRRRMQPIEASAGFLSKRQLADLAENLVEFTSLRNRVSLDRQETVGGATDVAVISKGDGFIWLKRKHYFDTDRNPNWGLQQAVADVALKLDSIDDTGMGSR